MNVLALIGAMSSALSLAGQIAYVDTGAGAGGQVHVLALEGGETWPVGPGRQDGAPRWSPDGSWLAFETGVEGGRGIYVVAHDGTEGRLIPPDRPWNTQPAWSTDGTRLLYNAASQRGAPGELHVYDLNGRETVVWGGGRAGLSAPQWMPYTLLLRYLNSDQFLNLNVLGLDTKRFLAEARMGAEDLTSETMPESVLAVQLSPSYTGDAFSIETSMVLVTRSEVLPVMSVAYPERARLGAEIWGVSANWGGARLASDAGSQRTFGRYTFLDPGESSRIAYESNEGGDREIYVIGRRGVANVTNHRAADWNPVWSPDGKSFAFESFRGGNRGVYKVYVDTAHVTGIATSETAACWSPAWSPDGEYLVYVSDEPGQPELFARPAAGGEAIPLTDRGAGKESPAWRPELE